MLVVDANVVAYLLVEGDKTRQARELWTIDQDWRAPRLLVYELANVFTQLISQQALGLESALAGLANGVGVVSILDREPPATRILEIATKLRISAYDACYLAAAEALHTLLVTEDSRLLSAVPEIARPLAWFVQRRG